MPRYIIIKLLQGEKQRKNSESCQRKIPPHLEGKKHLNDRVFVTRNREARRK
jgi:hypothetical protein